MRFEEADCGGKPEQVVAREFERANTIAIGAIRFGVQLAHIRNYGQPPILVLEERWNVSSIEYVLQEGFPRITAEFCTKCTDKATSSLE